MAMMLIIFGSVFVTGLVAFFVSRNIEHGEARFGPDGQLPPISRKTRIVSPEKVTIRQDSKTDE